MTTSYFTFGFDHRHELLGEVFDRTTIAKITAEDPRTVAFALFGRKWAFDYPGEKGERQVEEWNYRVIEIPAVVVETVALAQRVHEEYSGSGSSEPVPPAAGSSDG